jgi:DNA-binding YbaB/EbfC family protein
MFGLNQFELMQKMQQSLEESKQRLASLRLTGEAGGGLVRIELDGNRKLTSFQLNTELSMIDKEDLEDFIAVALEKAINLANEANEKEIASTAAAYLPGM